MQFNLNYDVSLDFQSIKGFPIWRAAEAFLHFGQKAYRVTVINSKDVTLEGSSEGGCNWKTILKMMICFTIALPFTIIAAITRASYRKYYSFSLIDQSKEQESPNRHPAVSNVEPPALTRTLYKVEEVIARIKQARDEGKKVGIVLGRGNQQSVPEEAGWKWFSLDESCHGDENLDRHLHMNFNNLYDLPEFDQVFDKVIVDYSTIKFFNNPWVRLNKLLVKREDSELIVESYSGCGTLTQDSEPKFFPELLSRAIPAKGMLDFANQKQVNFDQWRNQLGVDEAQKRYEEYANRHLPEERAKLPLWPEDQITECVRQKFIKEVLEREGLMPPEPPTYIPELIDAIRNYVQGKFFDHVELRSGLFPNRKGEEAIETDFWVMRSPKPIKLNLQQRVQLLTGSVVKI